MKRLAVIGILAAFTAACDDSPPPAAEQEPEYAGGGAHPTSSSGGGQVRIGSGQSSRETIAQRYQKALEKIKERDWDGAREELIEALHRSAGHPIQKDIREHLRIVEQGILAQPTYNVGDIFRDAPNLFEKKVSVRGTFFDGGKVGRVTYYFFVQTGRKKIQVRYPSLELDRKKTILLLKDGAQVLVRGTLMSPWGSNPDPYLEASYFRLEQLSPERRKELNEKEAAR